jgi:hypothetical protein
MTMGGCLKVLMIVALCVIFPPLIPIVLIMWIFKMMFGR